jgi:predicted amidohydrolase
MERFIAAGVQIAANPSDVQVNRAKILLWMEKAKTEQGADLIVFPESVTTGFAPQATLEELYDMAETIPGPFIEEVSALAKRLSVHVVLPVYEKGLEKGVIYNSSVLIDYEGRILGTYRKTHLFPTERRSAGGWSTPGREAPVFDTDLGKIGMIICYDGDFPELSRALAVQGAEIITRPSALLRSFEIWKLTNRARAYDNHVYVIGVNQIGPDAVGNYYFGHSQIISPIAHVMAQASGTEEIVAAEMDPEPLLWVSHGTKTPQRFDHLEDRNIAAYAPHILKEAKSAFEPSQRIPDIHKNLSYDKYNRRHGPVCRRFNEAEDAVADCRRETKEERRRNWPYKKDDK